MHISTDDIGSMAPDPSRRRRVRRSKYPRTDPRFWINVYCRNGKQGRPTYAGIPEAMHEPIRALKRTQNRKSRVKKNSMSQRAMLDQLSKELGLEAVKFAGGDRLSPAPTNKEVIYRHRRPSVMRLWPCYLLVLAMFVISTLYTSVLAHRAHQDLRLLQTRICQLETTVSGSGGRVDPP